MGEKTNSISLARGLQCAQEVMGSSSHDVFVSYLLITQCLKFFTRQKYTHQQKKKKKPQKTPQNIYSTYILHLELSIDLNLIMIICEKSTFLIMTQKKLFSVYRWSN